MNRITRNALAVLAMCLIGASTANLHAASFSDDNWSNIGNILNEGPLPLVGGRVLAAVVDGSGNLYVGGSFTIAGGVFATNIAKWNGSTWSALGSGVGGEVWALAVSGRDLYVGGWFTTAGGTPANYIARWNGTNWSALGSGVDQIVTELAVSGSDVYAGGYFTTAGGVSANHIAKWNGSSWGALGSGLEGNVFMYALAASGSNLYAGGTFTTAGGAPAKNIARWNGGSWSALGSGIDGYVYALAVSGSELYAGGWFWAAGGNPTTNIARWNGTSWSGLASGITAPDDEQYNGGAVGTLAASGTDLYAGGHFTSAGGLSAKSIAKWDGSSWSPLGSGMDYYGSVFALAVSGVDLYAGGDFTTAGGKVSVYIARAYLLSLPTLSVLRSSANATISWPSTNTSDFALERASALATPMNWLPNSATITDDGTNKSVTLRATNPAQFFRLRRP